LQKSKNYIEKSFYSGGGGGYSTIEDYSKFCSLILNKGEWNGRKLLSEKSFNLLISNQLNNKYIHEIAVAMNQEFLNRFKKDGTSHALGFAILENPNDYGWGGFYSTIYRINLELNSSYIMMPQIAYPFPLSKRGINLQSELRRLSYQLISENN